MIYSKGLTLLQYHTNYTLQGWAYEVGGGGGGYVIGGGFTWLERGLRG